MRKKVLVLYYTQSGQLRDIVKSFMSAFSETEYALEVVEIQPEKQFDFPWTSERFFDAMPETVLRKPIPLKEFRLMQDKYDLVVFAYQPWFLSLSLPANSILQHSGIKKILKDTPVVTLIAARNMWLNSQEIVKKLLQDVGAKLVGNVALVDRNSNLVSAVTILYWMMTGKKDKYLGVFPKPGVSNEDIANASNLGRVVAEYLSKGSFKSLQSDLIAQGAVNVDANLMFIERRAPRLFLIWANFILNRKNRKLWLRVFKYYLLIALFVIAPIVLAVNFVFFRVFFQKKIALRKAYYQAVELKESI
jgi:hypothetical protein